MTIRKNVAMMLVVLLGLWLVPADDVLGQPRGRRVSPVRSSRTFYHGARRAAVSAQPPARSAVPSSYDDYPRYTGAFHARYFQEIPSIYGPRPMRGTAW